MHSWALRNYALSLIGRGSEAELRRLEGGGALPGGALPGGDQIIDLTDDASLVPEPEPPAEPAIDCPCGAGPAPRAALMETARSDTARPAPPIT